MSATRLDTWPYFTITKSGVQYAIPAQATVQRDGTYRPVPVARNPKIAFPPPLTTANPDGSAARRNYDIDEVIFTTWQGGMGEDRYPSTSPPSSFQTSAADTRFAGVLVCRPLATQLGSSIVYAGALVPFALAELNYPTARLLLYAPGVQTAYRLNGSTWTAITVGGSNLTIRQHAFTLNGVFAVGTAGGVNDVYRSVDGATWAAIGKGAMTTPLFCAYFDERLWVLDAVTSAGPAREVYTVYSSVDAGTAAATATWVAGNAFVSQANTENVTKLFTWQYPPDKGRTTLWCLTQRRLLYYDYYAATPTWVTWHTFPTRYTVAGHRGTDCCVWPKNNNLYVCLAGRAEIWEFTGNAVTRLSPNKRGGLPAGSRLTPLTLSGNDHHLYAACGPHPDDTGGRGALVAMQEGGAFHHIATLPATTIWGGGVGLDRLWVTDNDGSGNSVAVYELLNPDEDVPPQNGGTRTYDSAALVLRTAWIAAGLTNVNKRVLYVEVDCLKDGGVVGLNTGATLKVEIVTRAATTSLGTLTDASTFPAVLEFAGGISCKEFLVQLTLTRGTATSATPFVRAVKIGYRPRPKQRYTYTLRADVRDECPAFQTANGLFKGHSAAYLRQFLDELSDNDDAGQDDPLVGLSYGGKGNSLHPRFRSISQCEVLVQSQESVEKADGLGLLTFNDVSSPTPG